MWPKPIGALYSPARSSMGHPGWWSYHLIHKQAMTRTSPKSPGRKSRAFWQICISKWQKVPGGSPCPQHITDTIIQLSSKYDKYDLQRSIKVTMYQCLFVESSNRNFLQSSSVAAILITRAHSGYSPYLIHLARAIDRGSPNTWSQAHSLYNLNTWSQV